MDDVTAKSTDVNDDIALKLMCGDESVCEEIVRNYAPAIQKWLLKLPFGLSREDAEDLVCEAIARLWEKRDQYDDSEGSLKSYLFQITKNLLLDRPKTSRFKTMCQERHINDDYLKNLAAPKKKSVSKSPQDRDEPILVALREALRELPEMQRKVLIEDAGATHELPAAQLGEILGGIPAGTIRQYRKRGKDTLRRKLVEHGFGGTTKGLVQ